MTYYVEMLLNRVCRMLEYIDLPDTIDAEFLNRELILNGVYGVARKGDALHAWRGMCGGEINAEYLPTRFIGASPVLGSIDKTLGVDVVAVFASTSERFAPYSYGDYTLDKKGRVFIKAPSDPLAVRGTSLYSYIKRTAEHLEEIDKSIRTLLKTTRAHVFVSAADDRKKEAAQLALGRIYNGELETVFQSDILDSLKFNFAPTATNAAAILKELKEQYQFWLAEFYHAIGINANYNLKRERLNTAEVDLNEQPLLVNISDMLKCSQEGWELINEIFGTSVRVRLAPEWERRENNDNAESVDRADGDPGDSSDGGDAGVERVDKDS